MLHDFLLVVAALFTSTTSPPPPRHCPHSQSFTRRRHRRRSSSSSLLLPIPSTPPPQLSLDSNINVAEIPEAPSEASSKVSLVVSLYFLPLNIPIRVLDVPGARGLLPKTFKFWISRSRERLDAFNSKLDFWASAEQRTSMQRVRGYRRAGFEFWRSRERVAASSFSKFDFSRSRDQHDSLAAPYNQRRRCGVPNASRIWEFDFPRSAERGNALSISTTYLSISILHLPATNATRKRPSQRLSRHLLNAPRTLKFDILRYAEQCDASKFSFSQNDAFSNINLDFPPY
ncbi:hypothetical protein R3P38DRAFT_3225641 [Favolaschia claudopus]|uniref:Uncharacterized protein n=1 Tax=Favolaschia claudopus TaxID=2862362 RepID=A0AAV9ZVG5_9AGAR